MGESEINNKITLEDWEKVINHANAGNIFEKNFFVC